MDSAGDENSLKKICAGVIEIDLAHNQLRRWSEVTEPTFLFDPLPACMKKRTKYLHDP